MKPLTIFLLIAGRKVGAWAVLALFIAWGGLNFIRYLLPDIRRAPAAAPASEPSLEHAAAIRQADCLRPLLPDDEIGYWLPPANPYEPNTAAAVERYYFLQSALIPHVINAQNSAAALVLFYSEQAGIEAALSAGGMGIIKQCEGLILARRSP